MKSFLALYPARQCGSISENLEIRLLSAALESALGICIATI